MLGPMPQYARIADFLPEEDHHRILEWAMSNVAEFRPAGVMNGYADSDGRIDHQRRIAFTTDCMGPFEPLLKTVFRGAVEEIAARTGTRIGSFWLELEFAAHGDGAFFAPHIDVATGKNRQPRSDSSEPDRILSAVYYFHREPKAFSGGALRLYRFGADPTESGLDPANHVDLEPLDNSLVAFPSTVLHEVRPVQCASPDFADCRFALNCWYCRTA